MERELLLRDHIRGLLLDYCRTHITEDYVTFTHNAVQTLLSDRISLVPLEDPSSITLPVDPMDTLLRHLDPPLIPEEIWATDPDALGRIRRSMNLGAAPLATSKCWNEIDPYERVIGCFRPVSPILTSKALRQTPKFGESRTAISPGSLRSALGAYTLVPVKVPDVPTPSLPTLEEILDIQYKIEPNLHRETMSLIRSVHVGTKLAPDRTNPAVEAFLRSESPPLPVVDTVEVPIFPRSSWPGHMDGSSTSSTKIPRKMSDLRCLAPTAEIEEEDLSMEHMRIVDGWTTYPPISSPSSTPSFGLGGTSSQVDELFPPSPPTGPGVGVPILELESLKMGEVQIPRQRRIGHTDYELSHRFHSLASLLPQHHISSVNPRAHREEPRSLECADDVTIASSMLGQPPSKFDDDEPESHVGEDDLEADLRAIWSKAGCGEFEIILQDGIDESEALLFEVPELPPPTAHTTWELLPRDLTSLASSLGMVKGLRPLNLELSWVPFKYGNKIPTNEEVSRVSEDTLDDLMILIGQDPREGDEVRRLLNDLVSPTPLGPVSDLAFVECTHPEDFAVAEILYDDRIRPHQLILTRDERRRVFRTGADVSGSLVPDSPRGLMGPTGNDAEITQDFDGGEFIFEELEFNSQILQRDFVEPLYQQAEGYEDGYEEELLPAPAKRRRLGEFSPAVDPGFESPLRLPDSETMRYTIPPPLAQPTSPRRAEILSKGCSSRIPLSPQNIHILPDITSQPHHPVPPDIPDATRHVALPTTSRAIEPSPVCAAGRRQDFAEYLAHRLVRLSTPPAATTTETATDHPRLVEAPQTVTTVPAELVDGNTIQLSIANSLPGSRHQYLASLDLLQKHALCRRLSDDAAAIDLIEREFLGGVDLILDQDTAILFIPLSAVPSECEGLITGISDISWRYSHILVIFEAFLVSQAFGDGEENCTVSFNFTEPILKSVKKLKRSLVIAEGVGTKTEDCLVSWAFATSIEEAARLARIYGDLAESRDGTGGSLWQERWWLGEREAEDSPLFEPEGENDLAMATGMNAFGARLVLSQMSSGQFLGLTSEERIEMFGQLLGTKRMVELNRVLGQSAVALSSPLPTSDPRDSSSTQQ